jgi:hypothetical protein
LFGGQIAPDVPDRGGADRIQTKCDRQRHPATLH